MITMDDFFKKASEDDVIKKELQAILDGKNEEELTEEDAQKVVELARKNGFDLKELGEMSDDDLNHVSGGSVLSHVNEAWYEARKKVGAWITPN